MQQSHPFLQEYDLEEVAKHTSSESCWLIIGNESNGGAKVYNVTSYLNDHPGGADVLLDVAGTTDADEFFESIQHSRDARKELQKYLIGRLKQKEPTTKAAAAPGQQTPRRKRRATIGRRLYDKAVLWQDWDQESDDNDDEEGGASAGYWELFTDLAMVAAATAIADIFQEEQDVNGFVQFALLYMITVNGWLLYTHHYTSRFKESGSLFHSFILFFFLLGMAASIVNASYKTARAFSLAVCLQRIAFLGMIVPVGIFLTRARDFVAVISSITIAVILCFFVVAMKPMWAPVLWAVAALLEYGLEVFLTVFLPGSKLVPINIEHTKERLGVLVLVMLGESVISGTITYREYAAADPSLEGSGRRYYVVLALSFLLIFMITLLFFNMQPLPKDHAFRRSRLAGTLVLVFNKTVGLALLTIGVCIKLAVEAVAENEEFSPFTARVFGIAVGSSMLLLFGMRICHYGGKVPRPEDPPDIRRLMWMWWLVFAVMSILPFCFSCPEDPIVSLSIYSGLLLALCVIESWFTHVLEEHLPNEESAPLYSERATYASVADKAIVT